MDLEAFLKDVLTPMLDHPEALRIEVSARGREREVLIHAEGEDRGRIIGRSARVISALRTLCILAGEKAGLEVRVELYEAEDEAERPPRAPRRAEPRRPADADISAGEA